MRSALFELQSMQANTQFVHVDNPPCARGTTWSIVSSSLPGCFPQYWQHILSRLKTFLRLKVTFCVGIASNLVKAMTSGIRMRWRTDWMNGSSRSGTIRLQSLQSYNWKSIGSTILAESFHSMIKARATVATLIGCQLRFSTRTGLRSEAGGLRQGGIL